MFGDPTFAVILYIVTATVIAWWELVKIWRGDSVGLKSGVVFALCTVLLAMCLWVLNFESVLAWTAGGVLLVADLLWFWLFIRHNLKRGTP